ncbi:MULTISPECIES: GntR family transcriptional regulator [Rhizobium/Agrobacterium group]|uniref:GntR family transcriptional regulator n=2 Tax=Agrobacterium TaxID=357 RepID=A0A546XJC3_AGRTU|nr:MULTISPECIES: GntR family transcriptional regulator [Rhizobium/Agrobacterium group]MCZ7472431.1 GntR family transcriptional regulator [Rhizobium rhizogenes]MCZ7483742.1 GntR family transcriptional regulator [Rhizobium rhizogenes]MEB3046222.1 GntR family transcriptional regulator [Rhizobium sp. MJ21]TRB00843.1 GntR family transcriptional regulator [Agrobacterium tumefaciens]WHO11806.1 GntR family transcriptional regulator [Agrobacterium cucumeris]
MMTVFKSDMGKIEYKPLNERAYDSIKSSLISGEFTPRQVLVIRTLAEAYGISTTPIREALQRLVGEGQLVMLANRSIAVPDWDAAKFVELFRIRCELEGLAAELATKILPPRVISELAALSQQLGDAAKREDHADYVSLNQRFHFTIYQHASSPRLLRIIENLWGEVGVYMNELFSHPGYGSIANEEHEHIVREIRNGNASEVRRHMVADISKAADFLLPRIEFLANEEKTITAQLR